jgi:hypothetical protein
MVGDLRQHMAQPGFGRPQSNTGIFPEDTALLNLDPPFLPAQKISLQTTCLGAVDCELVFADHVYQFDASERRASKPECLFLA